MKLRLSFVANSSSTSFTITRDLIVEPGVWRHEWTQDFELEPVEGSMTVAEAEASLERQTTQIENWEDLVSRLVREGRRDRSPAGSSKRVLRLRELTSTRRLIRDSYERLRDPHELRYRGRIRWSVGDLAPFERASLVAGDLCRFGAPIGHGEQDWLGKCWVVGPPAGYRYGRYVRDLGDGYECYDLDRLEPAFEERLEEARRRLCDHYGIPLDHCRLSPPIDPRKEQP